MITDARKIAVVLLTAGAVAGFGTVAQAAGKTDADDARAGIQTTIDKSNALMKRNGSVKEFADIFYEDDLMIIGEGEKSLYRGLPSFMKRLEFYMQDQTHCSLKIIDPIRHSGKLAVAFIQEHCDPAKPGEAEEDYRILYVFRNGAKGWRVTMELFTPGVF